MPEDHCSAPAAAPRDAVSPAALGQTPGWSGCGLLACSPRPGGNSDTAARLFAEGYASVQDEAPFPVFLRDYGVLPCTACDACLHTVQKHGRNAPASSPHALFGQSPGETLRLGCPLALKDDSAPLLTFLAETPALCLVSPIYFYHLPALLKALVDRTQPFWHLRNLGISPFSGQERICHIILLGAREQGERLFEGSLLTLKYALAGLGLRPAEPLLLYGLEGADDLAGNNAAQERVRDYGRQAAALLNGTR